MVDSLAAMAGAAILMFGVFFAGHFLGAFYVHMVSEEEHRAQLKHIGLINFAMLFTIFVLLAIKL